MSRICGSPEGFASWANLAERHIQDDGAAGSLARALATAVEILTEPRCWMERIEGSDYQAPRYQITDRLTSTRQIIIGNTMDVVAHATVFAAQRGGVLEMDVFGLDLPIAEAIKETGLVQVIKTRQGQPA